MINMKMPIWLDQTLDMAIRQEFAAEKLGELAGVLAALGLRQSVLRLNEWQRNCPELTVVGQQLSLYGLLDLARCNLQLAEQAGIRQVLLLCSAAQQAELGASLREILREADKRGLQISLLVEESSSLTATVLSDIITSNKKYPVATVFYWDKAGKGNPFTIFEQISILKSHLACPVGIAADNTYKMATANSLAALKAGAEQVITAIGGIGGHAPWEEIVMVARQIGGIHTELPPELAGKCRQVFSMLSLPLAADKAIIGPAIFAHESGLHVDGVSKSPEIYEPFAPELVGLTRQVIVGKHSGTAALKTKFAAWGIGLEEEESNRLLSAVRALAVRKKAAISDNELRRLYLSG